MAHVVFLLDSAALECLTSAKDVAKSRTSLTNEVKWPGQERGGSQGGRSWRVGWLSPKVLHEPSVMT